ncbi:hypothetical protein FDK12_08140 [Arthrobacter sp. NamB2]|uniref:hypothetical protein n=1 Tax=Arthrobacter sp. NamB2 TaxID=2576035 RepID=UPI0010CA084E|nr:hypothetical protein [Arthrobacter sp. NamB2]TKV28616.1 hypothetical protein FDK12_08140 [Arthrobacter sp. NamB2]
MQQPILDRAAFSRLVTNLGSFERAASAVSDFTFRLDERILLIEHTVDGSDDHAWRSAVQGLRTAAATAGAGRIAATAAMLLEPGARDAHTARGLIDQLRSDGRVFTLAHSALREELAFASELTSRRRP